MSSELTTGTPFDFSLECPQAKTNRCNVAKLLNKLTVSELAELSNLSKAYVSQVKNGNRPPSGKLIQALSEWAKVHNTIRPHQAPGYLTPQQFLENISHKEGRTCVTNHMNEYTVGGLLW
ncbi:helix-turn-helix domain-containing protein [Chloroflexota bacterium]